jgi:hypothetical protein
MLSMYTTYRTAPGINKARQAQVLLFELTHVLLLPLPQTDHLFKFIYMVAKISYRMEVRPNILICGFLPYLRSLGYRLT